MRTPSEDYRWQDHVPGFGSADIAAGIVIVAALWLAVAIQLPAGGRPDVHAAAPLVATPVSLPGAAAAIAGECGTRPSPGVAARKVDA